MPVPRLRRIALVALILVLTDITWDGSDSTITSPASIAERNRPRARGRLSPAIHSSSALTAPGHCVGRAKGGRG